jgi:hypothetical protein
MMPMKLLRSMTCSLIQIASKRRGQIIKPYHMPPGAGVM